MRGEVAFTPFVEKSEIVGRANNAIGYGSFASDVARIVFPAGDFAGVATLREDFGGDVAFATGFLASDVARIVFPSGDFAGVATLREDFGGDIAFAALVGISKTFLEAAGSVEDDSFAAGMVDRTGE